MGRQEEKDSSLSQETFLWDIFHLKLAQRNVSSFVKFARVVSKIPLQDIFVVSVRTSVTYLSSCSFQKILTTNKLVSVVSCLLTFTASVILTNFAPFDPDSIDRMSFTDCIGKLILSGSILHPISHPHLIFSSFVHVPISNVC